ESIPAFVLTAIILFLGIQPNWLLRWSEPTTNQLALTSEQPTVISYQITSGQY
ncbi:MAG: NAD(P)H-quinone oxidoreductase subunit D4, partial [Cyanobacteria bacterium P01_A01_bin.83]